MPNDACPNCGKTIPEKGAVLFGQCLDGLHICNTEVAPHSYKRPPQHVTGPYLPIYGSKTVRILAALAVIDERLAKIEDHLDCE